MQTIKTALSSIVIGIVTYFWASIYWMDGVSSWQTEQYLQPWVHRPLVPWLINIFEWVGISENIATVSVVTLTGVGLYLAMLALISATNNTVSEWKVMLAVVTGLVAFHLCRSPYDLMTALLWTLALLFIVKQNHVGFFVVLILACLNRIETAPLLIVLYWLRFPKGKLPVIVSSVLMFASIYILLHVGYADVPGSTAWISPLENLSTFWHSPWRTLLHFAVTVVILLKIVQRADYQPLYFQRAFVVLAPIFLVLYLVFGQAFELRVFWELFPVLTILTLL